MKHVLSLMLLMALLISCDNSDKKIDHDAISIQKLKKDSSEIEIADLPILMDSTDYLIHPIGHIREYSSRYSSESDHTYFNVSNHNSHSIRGDFSNIKFQHIDTSELKPLFDKVVKISSIHFLNNRSKNAEIDFIVYKVKDMDSNGDSKLNFLDINALYISKTDGSNLKKLTNPLDQIVDWKVIPELNRLYFKSISDTNKNGDFDKEDAIHYNYVNLDSNILKVETYHPI